jgi:hypothetical protein
MQKFQSAFLDDAHDAEHFIKNMGCYTTPKKYPRGTSVKAWGCP